MRTTDWMPVHCGDVVHRPDDPRHLGRVEAIHHGAFAKVRWCDTRWIEFISLHERAIVKTPKGDQS